MIEYLYNVTEKNIYLLMLLARVLVSIIKPCQTIRKSSNIKTNYDKAVWSVIKTTRCWQ